MMYKISQLPSIIEIGYTGEEKFRTVEIDMGDWMGDMPDGVPSIVHIRPGETAEDAYIAETTFEDGILAWEITQNDLGAREGTGLMQVWLEKTENITLQKRGKSVIVSTLVKEAISDPGDTIPPVRTALLNLTAEAEGLAAGAEPTAELEHEGYYGDYTLKLGIPKGDKGDKGDQGDPAPAELVTPAVDVYLEENFSNPSNPPLDRSLASSSSAAPADLVGSLKSAIDTLDSNVKNIVKESEEEDVDLDISDPNGNVILRLEDGHIKVKNFDSTEFAEVKEAVEETQTALNKYTMVKNSSATGVDLDISDNTGNVVARFQDGHIKVKNFDSSEVAGKIEDIEEDIAEIEEAITPHEPTSVTVDSVADLLDEIENGNTDIILIKNGTYDVLNIEVTRNVQIVGESRTGVILECDGTTDLVNPVTDRHGIRFNYGGALKNLTFNVNDVKYVAHQDNIPRSYDVLFENCTFNRYDDSCGYYFFIGCGCNGTQNITVKNCSFIFSENTHSRVSYGIYWHNWHLAKSQLNAYAANVTMENCGCVGCGMIIAQDLASKDVNDIISVLNCCSTETAPISSGANGYYLDVPNADVPYNILFIINSKIGNMILQDRTATNYAYLGAVVTNFTT